VLTLEKLAALRGMDPGELAPILYSNSFSAFRLQ
jgi:Mg-dependent DNase